MRNTGTAGAPRTDKRRARLVLSSVVALCLWLVAVPALASFPGQNGKIIWYSIGGDQTDNDVFEMKPNGDDQQRLRDDNIDNYDPQFSPNGNRIAFSSSNNDLWVMNANGGNAHVISPNYAEDPSWAGNNRVMFQRNGELYIINVNGGLPNLLLNKETAANEEEPDWSAVTNRVAFVRWPEAMVDPEIFTVKLNGTDEKRLTNNGLYDDDPDWSPKAKRLAYTCSPGDADAEICTMKANGRNKVNLTNNDLHADEEASWSPNGMFLVYERNTDGTSDDDIWKMKANGDNQTPLTVNDYDDDNPDWQAK